MKIFYTDEFVKMLERLPDHIRESFLEQEIILRIDWRHPRLHAKKLRGKPVIFSFRITRAYRAFFYFRAFDAVTIFAIGHRKDIYRRIRR